MGEALVYFVGGTILSFFGGREFNRFEQNNTPTLLLALVLVLGIVSFIYGLYAILALGFK